MGRVAQQHRYAYIKNFIQQTVLSHLSIKKAIKRLKVKQWVTSPGCSLWLKMKASLFDDEVIQMFNIQHFGINFNYIHLFSLELLFYLAT